MKTTVPLSELDKQMQMQMHMHDVSPPGSAISRLHPANQSCG